VPLVPGSGNAAVRLAESPKGRGGIQFRFQGHCECVRDPRWRYRRHCISYAAHASQPIRKSYPPIFNFNWRYASNVFQRVQNLSPNFVVEVAYRSDPTNLRKAPGTEITRPGTNQTLFASKTNEPLWLTIGARRQGREPRGRKESPSGSAPAFICGKRLTIPGAVRTTSRCFTRRLRMTAPSCFCGGDQAATQ